MNSSIILDFLISQRNGNTLCFNFSFPPITLIKESILRGYQISERGNVEIPVLGKGFSAGSGYSSLWFKGDGDGCEMILEEEDNVGFGVSPGSGEEGSSLPELFVFFLDSLPPSISKLPYYIE